MSILDILIKWAFCFSVVIFFMLILFFIYLGRKIGREEKEIMLNKKNLNNSRLK